MPRKADPPAGYIDVDEAAQIAGCKPLTIVRAARDGRIPDVIHRSPKSNWYFTAAGIRRWCGIKDDTEAGDAA